MTLRHALRLVAAPAVLASVLVVAPATPAAAVVECEMEASFDGPASLTLEYGEYWGFYAHGDSNFEQAIINNALVLTSTGVPSSYTPRVETNRDSYTGTWAYVTGSYETPLLGAGSYTFSLAAKPGFAYALCDPVVGQTAPPASLVITPAKLGIELRVLADPDNPQGAIVSAAFTGRFVQEYQSSFYTGGPLSPSGVWTITLKDSAGEVAKEYSVERAAGSDTLAQSFYWPDAEPGEQYTATATFQASGGNFDIADAGPFSYTAPESVRPVPTSTASAEQPARLPEPAGFGVPLVALILGGILIVALGALVTILSVRLSRRSGTDTKEVVA